MLELERCGFLRWIGGLAFDVMCKYRPWKSATYIVLFREQVGIDVARQLHSTALNFCVVDATPEARIGLARALPRLDYVPLAQAGAAVWPRGCAPRDICALRRCAHPRGAPHGRNQPPPRHARGAEWPAITLLAAGPRAPGRQAAIPAGLRGAILPWHT